MAQIDTLVEYILLCHKQLVFFFFSFIFFCESIFNWKKLVLSCLIQAASCGYFDLPRIKKNEKDGNTKEFLLLNLICLVLNYKLLNVGKFTP